MQWQAVRLCLHIQNLVGFGRYNLKRKVAGLPPVTRDWFDARKDQLSSNAGARVEKTWTDPLTKKRFGSENTYQSFVGSRKYEDLVRKSGEQAPKAVVTVRRVDDAGKLAMSIPPALLASVDFSEPPRWFRLVEATSVPNLARLSV